MYTTQFHEVLNVVCMHPDSLSEVRDSKEAFGESDSKVDNKTKMMEIFKGFDPRALALLELAEPSSVRLWKLLDMDPPKTRIAGRLCLLGDAALPFLPHIGLGAACAIEDAACLAALFPPGTVRADVPERLRLYEECRMPRAEKAHYMSRFFGEDVDPEDKDFRAKGSDFDFVTFYLQALSHDEYDYATQKLRELLYTKNPPRWSMPIAFGPKPGPRQTFNGREAGGSTFVRCCVRFKTSRTLLLNLLPRHSISFIGPGSVSQVSFSHTTFSNVSWLGGQSYDELGFYVHGVQCAKADGSNLTGSFLAVMFVNTADAIANDREELGIPKVFCDLEGTQDASGYAVKASWHGTDFAEMRLHSQANGFSFARTPPTNGSSSDAVEADSSVFVHRYIPAVANKGKPVADCIVCLPTSDRSSREARSNGAEPYDATIKFNARSAEKLPTLHHIVQRLAELPIIEIVKTMVTEGVSGTRMHEDAYIVEGF